MPTKLTDQLFGKSSGNVSLADQLGSTEEVGSLSDQLFGKPTPTTEIPKVETPSTTELTKSSIKSLGFEGEVPEIPTPFGAVADVAKFAGRQSLAAAELSMHMASSMLLYLPAKAYGVMALPFGREVADYAENEILKLGYQPFTPEGQDASKLVGKGFELLLAGPEKLDEVVSRVSPRTGYLIGLGAELATFAMTGEIVKGAKAKLKPTYKTAEHVINAKRDLEMRSIEQKEKQVGQIPDETMKRTQQKVFEVERTQAELVAKAAKEKAEVNIKSKEDLRTVGGKILEIKASDIRTEAMGKLMREGNEAVIKHIEKGIAREGGPAMEHVVRNQILKEIARVPREERPAIIENIGKVEGKINEVLDKHIVKKPKAIVTEKIKPVAQPPAEIPKPIATKEIDLQTGTPEPLALETNVHPLRQPKAITDRKARLYEEHAKSVKEDVEVYTAKSINDVNRWLDGEEIDIVEVRNNLSQLAAGADQLVKQFDSMTNFETWKTMVSDSAEWARKADRKINLQTGELPGTTLGAGIPIDEIIKEINNITKAIEAAIKSPNKKFEGVSLDRLKGDMALLKGAPEEYFNIMAGRMEVEYLRTGDKNAKIVAGEYNRIILESKKTPKIESGVTLHSGIPLDKAAKDIVAGAKKFAAYTKRARSVKSFKPKQAAQMLKEEFNRSFIDRSGNIRKELLDTLGDEGYKVVQKMVLSKGASSISANMLKQMQKEVYSGLTKNEKAILDNLILADRMADIGRYKTPSQFKFPANIDPKKSVAYAELFEQIEKLSPEKASDIRNRAKAYFDWMKVPLKSMLDSGLISEQEFTDLSAHNYRKLKLVDVFDKRYTAKVGAKRRTVYDSGVESLQRGRDTDIFEPSSEVMALEVFNRSYGRILNNEANKTLLDLARSNPENQFVRVKDKPSDRIPTGWNRIFVHEVGERKAVYLSPEMSKEWITNSPEMSYKMSQFIRYASGSPVLRTFATGIEWGFAVANLPRDVMHTWFAARQFQDGKWSSIYSSFLPKFQLQIGRDLTNVFADATTRGKRYQDYINEGGGMEFLVHQGRLFQRGRHLEGSIDKVYDFMGYFGETSEIMTRLAIRDRVIRNRAKEKGISYEEAYKIKEITQEATFAARDYMDFSQGGGIAKVMDNGLPYLNASIQGSRGLFRSFKDSPAESTWKLTQLATVVTGVYAANKKFNPQTMDSLEGDRRTESNLILPLDDQFGFEDDKGQTRYPFLMIPFDPGQRFFKTFFEASTDKFLGNEVDTDRVVRQLKDQSPVDSTSLPPTVSGVLGYVANKDFWTNEDIWRKTEPFDFPKSGEEFIPGRTPQAFIDLGAATGLSPERSKFAMEELFTGGSMWSYLAGQGYDELFAEMPKDKKEQHLAMILSQTPVVKRFFGITNPYSKFAQPIDEAQEKADLDYWIQNRELDRLAEGYLFAESVQKKEVFKYISGFKDIKVKDRLLERFRFQEAVKDLPERSFWLRLQSLKVPARAEVFVGRMKVAGEEEKQRIRKGLAVIGAAGGVVSKEFWNEVGKIRGQE